VQTILLLLLFFFFLYFRNWLNALAVFSYTKSALVTKAPILAFPSAAPIISLSLTPEMWNGTDWMLSSWVPLRCCRKVMTDVRGNVWLAPPVFHAVRPSMAEVEGTPH